MCEISNERLRVRFTNAGGRVRQEFQARRDGQWTTVVESFSPPERFPDGAAALYNSRPDPAHRLIVTEGVYEAKALDAGDGVQRVRLAGRIGEHRVTQTVTLRPGDSWVHVEVTVELAGDPPKLDCVLSPFVVHIDGRPDYTHAPSYKRSGDDVIGDRVFFAPSAIVQKGGLLAALAPDLDILNESVVYARGARQHPDTNSFPVPVDPDKVSMPAAMDLELQSGLTDKPLLAYGVMDTIIRQHVHWQRDPAGGAMVRELSGRVIRYGFDLLVSADAEPGRGYQAVARHLWRRYGHINLARPRPQAMPYAEYARTCYPAQFAYQGYEVAGANLRHRSLPDRPDLASWRQWRSPDGAEVGGLRLTAPQWYDLVYFTAWWNNVCDATGLYWWGRRLGDDTLIDKARRIVKLAVSAPQTQGLFPGLYHLGRQRWIGSLWRLPLEGYRPDECRNYWDWDNGVYQTASASLTCGYLMQYRRTCEDDPSILPFVRAYGDFLISRMQPNGCVPAWFDEQLRALPSLKWNADGGAHAWVLCELYRSTGQRRYLEAAERLAAFLITEVLPEQKWSDFEALYSCAVKAETFFDPHTGQPPRNLMSVSWAMQGLLALHEATGRAEYLSAAEAVADYASLFQAVWAPHYVITAYPFGGISSQIGDAEWLDQRCHRFVDCFVRLGILTGRQDLLERGVAAARASLTLVSCPRHRANDIYSHTDFPLGLGPENIDHEGFPQRPLSSGPSWSSVGALAGVAHALGRLGGAYVHVGKGLAVGVDGVTAEGLAFDGKCLRLNVRNQLALLPQPYDQPFEVILRVEGLAAGAYQLVLNGGPGRRVTAEAMKEYRLTVQPEPPR